MIYFKYFYKFISTLIITHILEYSNIYQYFPLRTVNLTVRHWVVRLYVWISLLTIYLAARERTIRPFYL